VAGAHGVKEGPIVRRERLEELGGSDASLRSASESGTVGADAARDVVHLLERIDKELNVVAEDLLATCAHEPDESGLLAGSGCSLESGPDSQLESKQ